jgi:hydrogenase-4 component B
MPWTAGLFLAGALAICGLPPFNGFMSELLVYLGLFKAAMGGQAAGVAGSAGAASSAGAGLLSSLAIPALAMVGALALACFVKLFGAVFLGEPRSDKIDEPREQPLSMLLPMALLAMACAVVGMAPVLVLPALEAAMAALAAPDMAACGPLASLAPLGLAGAIGAALLAAILLLSLPWLLKRRKAARVPTWDCGYAAPTARMQYTGSSFSEPVVGLFSFLLRPKLRKPRVEGAFPAPSAMSSHSEDRTLEGLIMPASREIGRRFSWFRRFQQGLAQQYVLYIAIAAIVLLCALIPFDELFAALF